MTSTRVHHLQHLQARDLTRPNVYLEVNESDNIADGGNDAIRTATGVASYPKCGAPASKIATVVSNPPIAPKSYAQ